MDGAQKRIEQARALAWWTAALPNVKKPPDFHTFVYGKGNRRADLARCIAAWDKVDAALARRH